MNKFERGLDPNKSLDIGRNSSYKKEQKQKKFSKAVNKVTKGILKDPELFYSYQANIAVCMQDAMDRYRKKHNKKYLSRKDRHAITNEGARDFLMIWCS